MRPGLAEAEARHLDRAPIAGPIGLVTTWAHRCAPHRLAEHTAKSEQQIPANSIQVIYADENDVLFPFTLYGDENVIIHGIKESTFTIQNKTSHFDHLLTCLKMTLKV